MNDLDNSLKLVSIEQVKKLGLVKMNRLKNQGLKNDEDQQLSQRNGGIWNDGKMTERI